MTPFSTIIINLAIFLRYIIKIWMLSNSIIVPGLISIFTIAVPVLAATKHIQKQWIQLDHVWTPVLLRIFKDQAAVDLARLFTALSWWGGPLRCPAAARRSRKWRAEAVPGGFPTPTSPSAAGRTPARRRRPARSSAPAPSAWAPSAPVESRSRFQRRLRGPPRVRFGERYLVECVEGGLGHGVVGLAEGDHGIGERAGGRDIDQGQGDAAGHPSQQVQGAHHFLQGLLRRKLADKISRKRNRQKPKWEQANWENCKNESFTWLTQWKICYDPTCLSPLLCKYT